MTVIRFRPRPTDDERYVASHQDRDARLAIADRVRRGIEHGAALCVGCARAGSCYDACEPIRTHRAGRKPKK